MIKFVVIDFDDIFLLKDLMVIEKNFKAIEFLK